MNAGPVGAARNVDIRRATVADCDAIARVQIDSWREAYRGLVPDDYLARLDYDRRARWFREHLDEASSRTFVVVDSRVVQGFLTLGPCRDPDLDAADVGEIYGIYLVPGRWRQGIGRLTCRYGEEVLARAGHSAVTLWVFAGNHAARRFYQAMGFYADGASKVLEVGAALGAIRYRKSIRRLDARAAPSAVVAT